MKERDAHTRTEEQEDPLDPAFDPTCIGIVDFSNAFNTLYRIRIHEGLVAYAPSLLPYFAWAYGSPAQLLLSNGYKICESETGIRQGDPLGPLYFSLGIDAILRELRLEFPGAHALAYLDDITIVGKRSEVARAITWLTKRSLDAGLKVNMDKTFILDSTQAAGRYGGINYVSDGLLVLGGPIGGGFQSCHVGFDPDFNEQYADSEMTQAASVLPKLALLQKYMAALLARVCINSRVMYLSRCLPPDVTLNPTTNFDGRLPVRHYGLRRRPPRSCAHCQGPSYDSRRPVHASLTRHARECFHRLFHGRLKAHLS